MSAREDVDFLWESLVSPAKSRRLKKSKKNKRSPEKHNKNNLTTKIDKQAQKKKKKKDFKSKEGMKKKKDKLKEKKKKKNRSSVEVHDSVVVTQSSNREAKPAAEHKTLNLLSKDQLQHEELTEEPQKKVRRKKKVAFDLTPGYIRVKRPKLCSYQQPPRESLLLEGESVREAERCSQATVTEHSHTQTHCSDSQCTSDDINSQDLFITQKTFRAPPSLPSSDEAVDKAITTTPAVVQMERRHNDLFQDSHFHQHHRESTEHVQKPKTEWLLLTEEKEKDRVVRKEQEQGKEDLCPIKTKSRVVNPYLDDPIIIPSSPEVTKSSSKSSPSLLQPLIVSLSSSATQTENFFTTELSSFLKFGQKVREAVHSEDMQPLDLSLPFRARKDLVKTSSVSEEIKSDNSRSLHPSCLSDMKEELKKPRCQCCSDSCQGKRERSVSSESDKSADVMISSEDSESSCRAGKLDLVQARAVQMRLNESFFFKTKGEGYSPRPESPLMKQTQCHREVKNKKGR